jgi:hypothetical protein
METMKWKNMSVKQLKDEATSLHSSIYQSECFGVKDLLNYEMACAELERRGYDIAEGHQLYIKKDRK